MIIYPFSLINSYDPSAIDFINTAGITNLTEKSAVNQLVISLKNYDLWDKMFAVYPFVGSTSGSCSYNLIDTSKYQITWSGGVTFNSNGITGNGSTGRGNTGWNPNTVNSTTGITASLSFSFYSRSSFGSNGIEMGITTSGNASLGGYAGRTFGAPYVALFDNYNASTGRIFFNSDGLGLFTSTRTTISTHRGFRNTTLGGTNTTTQTTSDITALNYNMFLLAYNGPTIAGYSSRNLAFVHIGLGLTNADVVNLYNTVQTFQTTLGRQV